MIDKKYIQNVFLKLVQIDSESGNEKEVRNFLILELDKFGVKMKEDKYGNLIGKKRGFGEPVFFSSHMDTVSPGCGVKPIVKNGVVSSSGETILGADDKAGIAEILGAVKFLSEEKIKHRALEIIFTREEEIGLVGAFNLDYKKIKSKEGLVVDVSGEPETVVIASPYIAMIDIEITGKTVHAGHNPEDGINAIAVTSDAISKLKLGRIDEETVTNIGMIQGGQAVNSVPGNALVRAEVRSHLKTKVNKQLSIYKKTFRSSARKYGAKVKFNENLACFGYKYSENTALIKKIIRQWEKTGKTPILKKVGSGSDANAYTQHKLRAIPVGYAGKNPHSTKEHVALSDMELISQFLVNFLLEK